MSFWASHLIASLAQSSIAAVIVLRIARALARRLPQFRHAVLMIGIIKFALPPMLPLPTGVFSAAAPMSEMTTFGRSVFALRSAPLFLMWIHLAGALFVLVR